jgi:hypothetical protein
VFRHTTGCDAPDRSAPSRRAEEEQLMGDNYAGAENLRTAVCPHRLTEQLSVLHIVENGLHYDFKIEERR